MSYQKETWNNTIPQREIKWKVDVFSAGNFFHDHARRELEERYYPLVCVTNKFNRQIVSYQRNKNTELHSWLKYKEGFSADLVHQFLDEIGIKQGDLVLDPFLGSGTTALVCKMRNINCIGFDILPITGIAVKAKKEIYNYNVEEIEMVINELEGLDIPYTYQGKVNWINITKGAYPEETDRQLAFYLEWLDKNNYSENVKNLVLLCMLNILEKVSYTAKDGQYLRWDYNSPKVIESNQMRMMRGKKPLLSKLNKGKLPDAKTAILQELYAMVNDIKGMQNIDVSVSDSKIIHIQESSLYGLMALEKDSINGVITSPPYCNRYDYTRTYALELAFLGIGEEHIKELRQSLLSCTVENKAKLDNLKQYYRMNHKELDYQRILSVIQHCAALKEVNEALAAREKNGEVNNKGIVRMVNNYFSELAFIYYELFRLCKPGAKVVFVNDNVRYAGEVIPVDFISTDIAEAMGFKPEIIYTLHQQKGNSSQQMKKYGRVALRKSITVWKKPEVSDTIK